MKKLRDFFTLLSWIIAWVILAVAFYVFAIITMP